jgi:hypothetical protein
VAALFEKQRRWSEIDNMMEVVDFSRSYLRWRLDSKAQAPPTISHPMPTSVNNVRIGLECCCQLTERATGRTHVYVLGAACKSERVGVQQDVWLEPNSDYCLVMSADEFLILKSWAHCGIRIMRYPESLGPQPERQSGANRDAWRSFNIQVKTAPGQLLDSVESVISATRGDRPIVARTEYDDGDFRVVIDHPVKTMNYSEREEMYQTDTGPILLPDLSAERRERSERLVECFDLAYSAFNVGGWAEFIVNVPTPVGEGVRVNHYSRARRIEPVRNQLIEVMEDVGRDILHAKVGFAPYSAELGGEALTQRKQSK